MTWLNSIYSSIRPSSANASEVGKGLPIPTGDQMTSRNLEAVKQSASDVFAKFDRSIADISAAIMGKPNTVTSRVEPTKTEVINGKVVQVKGAPETKEVTLDLSKFIDNPRKGEKESRCNNSLRTMIASLAKIEEYSGLPGHDKIAGTDGKGNLLDRIVCHDGEGAISLRSLQNKEVAYRVERQLSEERASGTGSAEATLLQAMHDIQNIGRAHYLADSDAPLETLNERLANKQNQLQAAMERKDGHGAYGHRQAAADEAEIGTLRKEIKGLKEIIFARHHQLKSKSGGDNEKLQGKGTARRLYYAIKRNGAKNYLEEGEISPLREELGNLLSFKKSGKNGLSAAVPVPPAKTHAAAFPEKSGFSQPVSPPVSPFSQFIYSELADKAAAQSHLPADQAQASKARLAWISQQGTLSRESIPLMAMTYFEKIREKRPDGDGTEMLIGSMMLADIYGNDSTFKAKSWADMTGLPLASVVQAKDKALAALDYRIEIVPGELAQLRDDYAEKMKPLPSTPIVVKTEQKSEPEYDVFKDTSYINALFDWVDGGSEDSTASASALPYQADKRSNTVSTLDSAVSAARSSDSIATYSTKLTSLESSPRSLVASPVLDAHARESLMQEISAKTQRLQSAQTDLDAINRRLDQYTAMTPQAADKKSRLAFLEEKIKNRNSSSIGTINSLRRQIRENQFRQADKLGKSDAAYEQEASSLRSWVQNYEAFRDTTQPPAWQDKKASLEEDVARLSAELEKLRGA